MQAESSENRIQRMANSVPAGRAILELLRSPPIRKNLSEAADRGVPPVTAVSAILLNAVGAAVMAERISKQFVGLVISVTLDEEGFVLDRSGVRIRVDGVFGTGSVYRRRVATGGPASSRPLLQRILDGLTPEERRWAAQYLGEIEGRTLVDENGLSDSRGTKP